MDRIQRKPLSTLASGFIGLAVVAVVIFAPLAIGIAGSPARQVLLTTL